jgi:hypothetical protein
MTLIKTLLACLILLGLQLPANAAADPAQFRLTEELLRKLQATDEEAKKLAAASRKAKPKRAQDDDGADADAEDEEEEEDEDEEDAGADRKSGKSDRDDSVEGIARKVDADPKLKALLAKHGISSTEYALSVHAMLHAGMYLMFESSMPKPKATELYSGYTKAQQANIELLRNSATMKSEGRSGK